MRSLSASIADLARRERCTPYMVLLAGFVALLSRYSDRQDLVIGTAVADRNQPELEKLIGFFVNTLALRLSWEGEPSFRDLLQRVRATTLERVGEPGRSLRENRRATEPPARRHPHTLLSHLVHPAKRPRRAACARRLGG